MAVVISRYMPTEEPTLRYLSLPDHLQRYFERGALQTPAGLVLIGFDELIPQQLSLLQTLDRSDCKMQWLQLMPKASQTVQIACADSRQEASLMARWARQKLEDNPEAQIRDRGAGVVRTPRNRCASIG